MMKIIRKIYSWFLWFFSKKEIKSEDIIVKEDSDTFSYSFVVDLPDTIKSKQILIIKDGVEPELLVLKCPCGCNQDIMLNLLKDTKPKWDFDFTSNAEINIYPSIWRNIGCKSHFFIKNGKVDWVI